MLKFVSIQSYRRWLPVIALMLSLAVTEGLSTTETASAAVSVTAVKATAGYTHGCAVMSDGTVRCFGRNSDGQLGNGTTSFSGSVSLVSGITNAIDVGVNPGNSDSANRSCALLSSGQIHCWGVNYSSYSLMATGDTVSRYLLPTPVCQSGSTSAGTCVPLANVVQMSIDSAGGCAITSTTPSTTTDNRVVCWGDTGNSSLNTSTVCTSGAHGTNNCVELTKVIKVDSNRNHRCAVTSDEEIYCWGSNSDGQLGREITSSTMRQAAPMTDGGSAISDGIDVATGASSTCIIRRPVAPATTNRIQCVGDLYYGHLGDGVADQTTNSRRITWRDICGHSRSVPSTSSCSTTQLPGSPTRLVGGTVSMCAYIANGYGTNDNGWSCWNGGPSGLHVYLGRPSSSSGSVYGYIGQVCTSSSAYSASGECEPAKRFAASEIDMTGSTICGVASGAVYCWGMGAGGSIIGQNSWVYYPYLISMGKSLRFASLPSGAEPNVAFAQQPRVQLVDEFGADASTSGVVVTATMTALSGAGALSGSTTATTNASGLAVFNDLAISAAGTYVVSFSATAFGSLGQRLVVVQMQARTLTISTNYTSSYLFTGAIPDVAATASAGTGTITYSTSTPSVCSVNPSTGSISAVNVGTCTVRANIVSDGNYVAAVSSDASFSITRLARTLTIDSSSFTSGYTMPVTGPTLQAVVSAGSGPISFASSTLSVCQVGASTGVVTFVGSGTCLISASVPASGDYQAAASPAISITVTGAPVVTPTSTVAPTQTIAPSSGTTVPPVGTDIPSGPAPVAQGVVTTVVPTTTLPAPSTTTTTTLPSMQVPEVADDGGALVVDGERIEATITRENNQLVIAAGVLRARISAVQREGGRAPLDSLGRIRMDRGDSIEIEVTGFGAQSQVEVRVYSDPVLLGRSTVSALGNLMASYEVPDSVDNGRHTVVLSGESQQGEKLTFALAVFIGAESTGPSTLALLVGIPLGLAVIAALVIPAILRRRRKDEDET